MILYNSFLLDATIHFLYIMFVIFFIRYAVSLRRVKDIALFSFFVSLMVSLVNWYLFPRLRWGNYLN